MAAAAYPHWVPRTDPAGQNDKTGPARMDPGTGNAGNPCKSYVFSDSWPVVIIRKTRVLRRIMMFVKVLTMSWIAWYDTRLLIF